VNITLPAKGRCEVKIDRSKEWWMKKADLEGDSPVGAGMLARTSSPHIIDEGDTFVVMLSCCGRDDGQYGPVPWADADAFRESYLSGIGVGSDGHKRSAIIVDAKRLP
jgi:hypothetical protein